MKFKVIRPFSPVTNPITRDNLSVIQLIALQSCCNTTCNAYQFYLITPRCLDRYNTIIIDLNLLCTSSIEFYSTQSFLFKLKSLSCVCIKHPLHSTSLHKWQTIIYDYEKFSDRLVSMLRYLSGCCNALRNRITAAASWNSISLQGPSEIIWYPGRCNTFVTSCDS